MMPVFTPAAPAHDVSDRSVSTHRSSARLAGTLAAVLIVLASTNLCRGQSTIGNRSLVTPSKRATFAEYLIVKLKATTDPQKSYVRLVAALTEAGRLDKGLVLSMERYSRRKNPRFPLPVFERALRFEGAKRGVALPTIKEIVARNGASTAEAIRELQIR